MSFTLCLGIRRLCLATCSQGKSCQAEVLRFVIARNWENRMTLSFMLCNYFLQTPGLGRSLGGGHGNSLQYSCLENPQGFWGFSGEPGRLQSMGSQRVGHNWATVTEWKKRRSSCFRGAYFSVTKILGSFFPASFTDCPKNNNKCKHYLNFLLWYLKM